MRTLQVPYKVLIRSLKAHSKHLKSTLLQRLPDAEIQRLQASNLESPEPYASVVLTVEGPKAAPSMVRKLNEYRAATVRRHHLLQARDPTL